MVDRDTMGKMSKTFRIKLAGLAGILVALVTTAGCMGGGGGGDQMPPQPDPAACNDFTAASPARTCKDGSTAKRYDGVCKLICPEDGENTAGMKELTTGTSTGTSTGSATGSGTSTVTSTATETVTATGTGSGTGTSTGTSSGSATSTGTSTDTRT